MLLRIISIENFNCNFGIYYTCPKFISLRNTINYIIHWQARRESISGTLICRLYSLRGLIIHINNKSQISCPFVSARSPCHGNRANYLTSYVFICRGTGKALISCATDTLFTRGVASITRRFLDSTLGGQDICRQNKTVLTSWTLVDTLQACRVNIAIFTSGQFSWGPCHLIENNF